jgi:hypothetical protein
MPTYNPPVKDTRFLLDAVLGLQNYSNLAGFEADRKSTRLNSSHRYISRMPSSA